MKYPLIFIIAVSFMGITACKKLQVKTDGTPISNEESALMIAGSLASGSNGLAAISNDISLSSQTLYTNATGCGATHVDTIVRQNQPGSVILCSFKQKITNKLNCNANKQADNVSSTLTFSGNYNGPKISANGNGSSTVTVAGLTPAAQAYVINGQFKTMGTFKLKADTARAGTISIDITVKNLLVNKATASNLSMISSGTATCTITGNSPKGAFLFEGTIAFPGYNEAILTLGTNTYSINLSSGTVEKKK
ncbi:hypothetical protein [Mucilaginibacter sp. UYCu711]|uniref:hypothetical protein n=1 Tax=Mucilaginibacter sp. UYCu711 TaxID=3156339 RepID=UPI003D1959A2